MNSDDKHLLFEMYKLHAALAEQAASHREGLNKLYSGMVTSVVAASVLLDRVAPDTEMVWVLPTLGILVSLFGCSRCIRWRADCPQSTLSSWPWKRSCHSTFCAERRMSSTSTTSSEENGWAWRCRAFS